MAARHTKAGHVKSPMIITLKLRYDIIYTMKTADYLMESVIHAVNSNLSNG
jgi:hypothetical protein